MSNVAPLCMRFGTLLFLLIKFNYAGEHLQTLYGHKSSAIDWCTGRKRFAVVDIHMENKVNQPSKRSKCGKNFIQQLSLLITPRTNQIFDSKFKDRCTSGIQLI